jgi:hypothetical protein
MIFDFVCIRIFHSNTKCNKWNTKTGLELSFFSCTALHVSLLLLALKNVACMSMFYLSFSFLSASFSSYCLFPPSVKQYIGPLSALILVKTKGCWFFIIESEQARYMNESVSHMRWLFVMPTVLTEKKFILLQSLALTSLYINVTSPPFSATSYFLLIPS